MCRFTPDYAAIRDLIRSGRIGEPKLVRASFGFASKRGTENFRFVRTEGGGGLMDVGSYCVQLADWVFDRPHQCAFYAMETAGDGYDAVGSGTVDYGDGLLSFNCAVHLELVNGATIFGTEGRIEMPRPWFCDQPFVVSHGSPNDPSAVVTSERFHLTTNDLYAYEIDAVARQISSGSAAEHPLTSTLRNMQTLDALRASAGLSFMPSH
jgi:predicted dehydrogenase